MRQIGSSQNIVICKESNMASNIITISRQYGSGGREVGKKLANILGYAYYDKEIINQAVDESPISKEMMEKNDENIGSSFSYYLSFTHGSNDDASLPLPDRVFMVQSKVIKELAAEGPCVIIGRSADYILRDEPSLLRVLIYGDMQSRIARVMERNNLTEKGAIARIKRIDKGRALYYEQFTGNKWCDAFEHDISISTSKYGIDGTAEILANIAHYE